MDCTYMFLMHAARHNSIHTARSIVRLPCARLQKHPHTGDTNKNANLHGGLAAGTITQDHTKLSAAEHREIKAPRTPLWNHVQQTSQPVHDQSPDGGDVKLRFVVLERRSP